MLFLEINLRPRIMQLLVLFFSRDDFQWLLSAPRGLSNARLPQSKLQVWDFWAPATRDKVGLLLLLSHFSRFRLCVTPQMAAHQDPCPWDSPGKNTGVGFHFLLQCMKVKSESEVAQSCPTLSDPMDCSLPGSSVHGVFQARVLEWGAIAFSLIIQAQPSERPS